MYGLGGINEVWGTYVSGNIGGNNEFGDTINVGAVAGIVVTRLEVFNGAIVAKGADGWVCMAIKPDCVLTSGSQCEVAVVVSLCLAPWLSRQAGQIQSWSMASSVNPAHFTW